MKKIQIESTNFKQHEKYMLKNEKIIKSKKHWKNLKNNQKKICFNIQNSKKEYEFLDKENTYNNKDLFKNKNSETTVIIILNITYVCHKTNKFKAAI